MKITKETLKQIIKEEVQAALEEGMPGSTIPADKPFVTGERELFKKMMDVAKKSAQRAKSAEEARAAEELAKAIASFKRTVKHAADIVTKGKTTVPSK